MTYKFRAWHKGGKRMIDDVAHICWNKDGTIKTITERDGLYYIEGFQVFLMQYVVYLDKNGVEIFEKDIIKSADGNIWLVKNIGHFFWMLLGDVMTPEKDYEVIGNIYHNPELLTA